jgi:hypothetical protein
VKRFKKPRSMFYWYSFTVRGRRYRASTPETKSVRGAANVQPETGFGDGKNGSTSNQTCCSPGVCKADGPPPIGA